MINDKCQKCDKVNYYDNTLTGGCSFNGFVCYNCKSEQITIPNNIATYCNCETYSEKEFDMIQTTTTEEAIKLIEYMVTNGKLASFQTQKLKRTIEGYEKSRDKYDM